MTAPLLSPGDPALEDTLAAVEHRLSALGEALRARASEREEVHGQQQHEGNRQVTFGLEPEARSRVDLQCDWRRKRAAQPDCERAADQQAGAREQREAARHLAAQVDPEERDRPADGRFEQEEKGSLRQRLHVVIGPARAARLAAAWRRSG